MACDYFTPKELSDVMGVARCTVHKYMNQPGYYTAHMVGSGSKRGRWVINKQQFFDWYTAAKRDGELDNALAAFPIDRASVDKAMSEFFASKYKNTEKRRIELADAMYRKRLKGRTSDRWLKQQREHT